MLFIIIEEKKYQKQAKKPPDGIEPSIFCLQGRCLTTWPKGLIRNISDF